MHLSICMLTFRDRQEIDFSNETVYRLLIGSTNYIANDAWLNQFESGNFCNKIVVCRNIVSAPKGEEI